MQTPWLPHPADATWTYEWSDSVYNATPTKEKVTDDQAAADLAVRRMALAAEAPPGTFRAQPAAIIAYNDRVKRIKTLGIAVERERQRLEREL